MSSAFLRPIHMENQTIRRCKGLVYKAMKAFMPRVAGTLEMIGTGRSIHLYLRAIDEPDARIQGSSIVLYGIGV